MVIASESEGWVFWFTRKMILIYGEKSSARSYNELTSTPMFSNRNIGQKRVYRAIFPANFRPNFQCAKQPSCMGRGSVVRLSDTNFTFYVGSRIVLSIRPRTWTIRIGDAQPNNPAIARTRMMRKNQKAAAQESLSAHHGPDHSAIFSNQARRAIAETIANRAALMQFIHSLAPLMGQPRWSSSCSGIGV